MKSLVIRRVGPQELPEALRFLAMLNPEVEAAELQQRLETILSDHSHYQLHAAYGEDLMVGVCGIWVATKIWCGKYLEIDNLVVDPHWRSRGVGSRLMSAMEAIAGRLGCRILVLDSYAANTASHRLYHRLGYEIKGFHFVKAVGIQQSGEVPA